MLIALKHMKACSVIHGDIKLDNILVNETHSSLRVCDFGTADYLKEVCVTPLMVSRFYRAPEIIVGLRYDYGIDLWSVVCCVFELYTSKFMFPGRDNNEMLKLHQEVKGHLSKKMLK